MTLLGIGLASCSPKIASIKVYEGQYLVKTSSAFKWCGESPSEDCQEEVSNAVYDVTQVNSDWSVIRKEAPSINSVPNIIDYDPNQDLCLLEGIEDCEPNYVWTIDKTTNDTFYNQLWGLHGEQGVHATRAWDIATNSTTPVAVLDTGIDCSHPELKDSCIGGYNAITNKEGIEEQKDDNGHGTHVAGTICAMGNNSDGISGVAWGCNLIGLKFLGANGSGSTLGALRALDYLSRQHPGARILSGSYGGGGYSQSMFEALSRFGGGSSRALLVFAAGNSGVNTDETPHYPSSYELPNIISVAASNESGKLANFSNYGKESVDVAAPGTGILSTWLNRGYKTLQGTSMATPHVSGVAGLLLTKAPELTGTEAKETIENTTRTGNFSTDKIKTDGIIDAYHALSGEGECSIGCKVVKFMRCLDRCEKPIRPCRSKCREKFNCPAVR